MRGRENSDAEWGGEGGGGFLRLAFFFPSLSERVPGALEMVLGGSRGLLCRLVMDILKHLELTT